jgi:hypothetical protein
VVVVVPVVPVVMCLRALHPQIVNLVQVEQEFS